MGIARLCHRKYVKARRLVGMVNSKRTALRPSWSRPKGRFLQGNSLSDFVGIPSEWTRSEGEATQRIGRRCRIFASLCFANTYGEEVFTVQIPVHASLRWALAPTTTNLEALQTRELINSVCVRCYSICTRGLKMSFEALMILQSRALDANSHLYQ